MTTTKLLACTILLAACVPMQTQQGGWGAPEPEPVADTSDGVGCMDVIGCSAGCGADEACISTCQASGDAPAQAAVHALLDCASSQCNNDGDCVTTTCRAEIDQCTGSTGVATAPEQPIVEPTADGQPSSTASLLPWLEGQWVSPNHQFTFWSDGSVLRASGVAMYSTNTQYGCVSTINEHGTVTQEGDLLIMVFPVSEGDTCGTSETSPGLTVRYRIEWYQYMSDEWNLALRDIDCTKGDMYCVDRMTRR